MFGRSRILAVLLAATLTAVVLVVIVMRALNQVQPFYRAALEVEQSTLDGESRAMESRVAALVSSASEEPRWHAVFSDGEVNGWLAVALKEKFPALLPKDLVEPRVAFLNNQAVVGFRLESEDLSTVISVRVRAWVSDNDLVAIRLQKCHAGNLPIPLSRVVEHMTNAARTLQVPIRWRQQEGDPVALISLPGVISTTDQQRRLVAVELHEGELYIAGSTLEVETLLAEKPEQTLQR